jgi:hypothetical protein
MSTLSVRIPKYLHDRIKRITAMESTSINQFIASALAEKIAALETESYLEERAKRASKRKFHKVLDKIPDVEAESFDT